jgi:hypothetical protein
MSHAGRNSATDGNHPSPEERVREALVLLEQALALLDANEGPGDVGAHLDLAINRLKDWLDSGAA